MKKLALIFAFISLAITAAFPATVTVPKTWIASETIKARDLNANFQAIASGVNGGLDFSNFSPGMIIPMVNVENGYLIASHAVRHRLGGADALAGSFTINLVDSYLANSTCSSPTVDAGIANKRYVDNTAAAIGSISTEYVRSHIENSVNPHGSTLTQTNIIASRTSSGDPGGGFYYTATGATLFSQNTESTLSFTGSVLGTIQPPRGRIRLSNTDPAEMFFDIWGNDGWVTPLRLDGDGSHGMVDFGGASLTNFGLSSTTIAYISSVVSASQSSEIQFLHNEIDGLAIGSSPQNILPITIPASFSAGYYDLDLYMNVSNWGSGELAFIAYLPMAPGNDGYRIVNVPNNGDLTHLSCHTLKFFNPSDGFSVQVYTATGTAYISNCQLTATYRGPSLKAY